MNDDLYTLLLFYLLVGTPCFVFLMVALTTIHELGHIWACVYLGVKVNYVVVNLFVTSWNKTIWILGIPVVFKAAHDDYLAVVNYEGFTPKDGLCISLAGPLLNGLVFVISLIILSLVGMQFWGIHVKFVCFMWLIGNLLHLVINLIPYPKSDGALALHYLRLMGIK